MLTCPTVLQEDKKKKNPVYKNQGREPIHQKYKANESTSGHNPKKKQIKRVFTNPHRYKVDHSTVCWKHITGSVIFGQFCDIAKVVMLQREILLNLYILPYVWLPI